MAVAKDNQQLLESLRRVGDTSRGVAQNSRYTPPAGARMSLGVNDERLRALRAAPQLKDQIDAIAAGKPQPSGAAGTIGKLILDNPVSKVALNALSVVDTPRRAVISGVRELVDLVDGDSATKGSFADWYKQTADPTYGFGTAFPMDGWGGRILGFVGDVALDPLTYATLGSWVPAKSVIKSGVYAGQTLRSTLGVRTLAGAEGRFALARLSKTMGASDEAVKQIAARGAIAVPAEIADNIGLRKAGIYYFGTRVRVPLSAPVANLVQRGLVRTRLGFFGWEAGEKIGRQFALRGTNPSADTSLQRFRLATGKTTAQEAGAFIGEFAAQDVARATKRFAIDTAVKYSRQLMDDPDVQNVSTSVYRLLDTPQEKWAELGISPTATELKAYDKIRPVFERMHADVEAAFANAGVPISFGKISDYLPHMATDDALKMMDDEASAYAKQIRQYLTVNQTDNVGSFRSRTLRKGSDWFSQDGKYPALTQADIDGGVQRLNQLFRERTGLDFDFYETDIKKILNRYSNYYGQQIGSAAYMKELFGSDNLRFAKEIAEFSEDYYDIVNQSVKTATNAHSESLKGAYEDVDVILQNVIEASDVLTRKTATRTRPVGELAQVVADAKATLKEIPTEEKALARLVSAKSRLQERMNKLSASWRNFENQFAEESDILDMMRQEHNALVAQHEKVMSTLNDLIRNDQFRTLRIDEVADTMQSLKNEISNLNLEIRQHGSKWETMLEKQQTLLGDFDKYYEDPWAGLGDSPADRVLGLVRFSGRGKQYDSILGKLDDKTLFSDWSGQNTTDAVRELRLRIDPNAEFSAAQLKKMTAADVREIISSGFTSAADTTRLRMAAAWLVARDIHINGGLVPTDEIYFGRLKKMEGLIARAIEVDRLVRSDATGEKFVAGFKNVVEIESQIADLDARSSAIVQEMYRLEDKTSALMDILYKEEDKLLVWAKTEREIEVLRKELNTVNDELRVAENNRQKIIKKYQPEQIEAFNTLSGNNFRQLTEELSESISEYYFHSQVRYMFSGMTEEAASLGLVPTERMYNALVARITEYDLELAGAVSQKVKATQDLFASLREANRSYTGTDAGIYLLNNLIDLFKNPERAADAALMREMFPEVEAVVARRMDSFRSGRAYFRITEGDAIARSIDETMKRLGVAQVPGTYLVPAPQTGRKITRQARIARMTDEQIAAEAEEFRNLRIVDSAELQESSKGLETRFKSVKQNLQRLLSERDRIQTRLMNHENAVATIQNVPVESSRNALIEKLTKSGKLLDEQTVKDLKDGIRSISEIELRHSQALSTVSKHSKWANGATKRLTGKSGKRSGAKIMNAMMAQGDSFGIGPRLSAAIGKETGGSPLAVESFFADLIGGVKPDYRIMPRNAMSRHGKLVRVIPMREDFVNIYQRADNRLVDSAGQFVNDGGNRVDIQFRELDIDGNIAAETGKPVMKGAKSTRPTILVKAEDSELGKIRSRAASRYGKLRSLSVDAELMPTESLKMGTRNPDGSTSWLFTEGLVGRGAYAHQLELALDVLDDKQKVVDRLTKEVSDLEKKAATKTRQIDRAQPSEARRTVARRRIDKARRLSAKLDALTQGPGQLRAQERRSFNDFLKKLALLDENSIENFSWNISADEFPVGSAGRTSVDEEYARILERNIEKLRQVVGRFERGIMAEMRMPASANPQMRQLNAMLFDLEQTRQRIADAAATGLRPEDFAFTRAEFMSLWSEITPEQAGVLRREFAQLSSELNARVGQQSSPVYARFAPEKIAENTARIEQVMLRMREVGVLLDQVASQDVALRKAKFLFDKFDDVEYQRINGIAQKMRTRNSTGIRGGVGVEVRFGGPKTAAARQVAMDAGSATGDVDEVLAVLGGQIAAKEKEMATLRRGTGQYLAVKNDIERLRQQFHQVSRAKNNSRFETTVVQQKDVVSWDKRKQLGALNLYLADAPAASDAAVRQRRANLNKVFNESPEGQHLIEVSNVQKEIVDARMERDSIYQTKENLMAARREIQAIIAEKRREIAELRIDRTIDDANEILSAAQKQTKTRLGKVSKQEPLKTGRQAQKALERDINRERGGRRFFELDEELFGSLQAKNAGELTEKQSQRRDMLERLYALDLEHLALLDERKATLDAVNDLVKVGDEGARALGLPLPSQILRNLELGKELRKSQAKATNPMVKEILKKEKKVAALTKSKDAVERKIDDEFVGLNDAVKTAQAAYDFARTSRKPAEETLRVAQQQYDIVKQLNSDARKLRSSISAKTDSWYEEFDEFMLDVEQMMPMLKGTDLEKPIRDVHASFLAQKAIVLQEKFGKSIAEQEKRVLDGIKGLVSTDPAQAALTASLAGPYGMPNAINFTTIFDEGFVQLSEYFPNIGVRKELAEIVQNVHRAQDPAVTRELAKFLTKYTQFFKGYATLSPGFHVRNGLTNGFMLFAAGGRPQFLAEALQWSKSWTAASGRGVTFAEWIKTVPQANRQVVYDAMMATAASGGGLVDDALREGTLFGTKTSRKLGQWLEQHSRFMLAYDGIRSGMDMQASAARVRRFLVDYENVSNADLLMRQIIPFWMWTSRNVPMHLMNIWMNPRAYQIYGAIKRNLEDKEDNRPVPLWMREMGAFKLPFGKNLYASPDLGFNRLNQDIEQLRDPARFASNLNPLIRLPIELMGGRQLYSGRPFDEQPVEVQGGASSVIQPLLQALGYGETGPTGKKFVDDKAYYALRSLIPTLSQAERLIPSTPAYQERGIANPLLGYLGAPVRQVTQQMSESEVKRMQAQLRELAERGKTLRGGEG